MGTTTSQYFDKKENGLKWARETIESAEKYGLFPDSDLMAVDRKEGNEISLFKIIRENKGISFEPQMNDTPYKARANACALQISFLHQRKKNKKRYLFVLHLDG